MKKLSNKDLQFLNNCLKENEKIEAVKFIHKVTAYNLKASKEIIDLFFENPSFFNDFEYQDTINKKQNNKSLSDNDKKYLNSIIKSGKKIEAVKFIYEKFGITLKEAKEYVDNFSYKTEETKNNNIIQEKDPVFKKINKEPISFKKIKDREKKRKIKSNSGCLLTLSLFVIIGIIITTSFLHLF